MCIFKVFTKLPKAISKALIEDRVHAFMGQWPKSVARLVGYMLYQHRTEQNRAQSRLLYLFYDKEQVIFFKNSTLFLKRALLLTN